MADFPPLNANSMKSLSAFRSIYSAATAKWLQSCPTLCDPIDGSPPGAPVPGILQARILEWVAISFSIKTSFLKSAALTVTVITTV